MRLLVVSCCLLGLAARGADAQASALSIEPFGAYVSPGAIYDKTITFVPPPGSFVVAGTSTDRLTVESTRAIGVRGAYRLGAAWTASAEASWGLSDYHYFSRSESGPSFSEEEFHGSAAVASLLVTASRTIVATPAGMRVDALILSGVQRLNVIEGPSYCPPPSLGIPVCSTPERWQGVYSVPSIGGGLAISRDLTPRLGLRSRATYTVGRADTSRFWTDLLPDFDAYEADRSHRLGVLQLSLGLGIGL
jgi:hypothetical protein